MARTIPRERTPELPHQICELAHDHRIFDEPAHVWDAEARSGALPRLEQSGGVAVDVTTTVGYVQPDGYEVEDAREEIEIIIFQRQVIAPQGSARLNASPDI